jgi:predicted tellurium resistance membrane protein TerC
MTEDLIALVALTAMEIVLGIDNIVFISILTSRLPAAQQPSARRLGLALAMGMRILLLFSLSWILALEEPFLHLSDLHIPLDAWLSGDSLEAVDGVSVRDLILIAGGLFLIAKSVHEVHAKLEGADHRSAKHRNVSFGGVLVQIAVLDIVFSLDSVITAVGMAKELWVMVTAVMLAVGVMMVFAGSVSRFVEKHPTIKMLALSFLILIGVMLVADGVGTHINKGYIYFAMCFALIVEFLNLRIRAASRTPDSTAKHEGA